jgi:hypothetical protein
MNPSRENAALSSRRSSSSQQCAIELPQVEARACKMLAGRESLRLAVRTRLVRERPWPGGAASTYTSTRRVDARACKMLRGPLRMALPRIERLVAPRFLGGYDAAVTPGAPRHSPEQWALTLVSP